MWMLIDKEVQLTHCDIYSFNPGIDCDPLYEAGTLWSFNYFFYNKMLKRIIFFTCRCVRKTAHPDDMDDDQCALLCFCVSDLLLAKCSNLETQMTWFRQRVIKPAGCISIR